MKKHLFITGPSGCGKSTLIRDALADAAAYAGGFVGIRKLNEDGTLQGFDLYPAAALANIEAYEGLRFLDYTKTPPAKDNEVFRNQAAQMLREAEYYPYVLIDEIGGFEMLIPQFRNALADLLNMDIPIIGVLKGAQSVKELKARFGLGDRFTMMTDNLHNVLKGDEDTVVLEMKKPGDEVITRIVRQWAEEYAHM